MTTKGDLCRRLEALERLAPSPGEDRREEIDKYVSSMSEDDLEFWYHTYFSRDWDQLSPSEQDRLAVLLATVDPDGMMMRRYQNPPPSLVPPGATEQQVEDIYRSMLQEGKR